jgi:hypothetical protein
LLASELAVQVREARESLPSAHDKANPPLALNCPSCGHGGYRKVKAKRTVAFVADRVCLACDRRYAPPTPKWAAVVFLVAGLILAILGTGAFLLRLGNWQPSDTVGGCFEVLLAVMGALAVTFGIRQLMNTESAPRDAIIATTRSPEQTDGMAGDKKE